MSKLSRKEFKELLTEWSSNFINERGKNIKYHVDKVSQSGHLISPRKNELSGMIEFIKEYIENSDEPTGLEDLLHKEHFANGIVFPKNDQVINILEDFFLFTFNEERANELSNTRNDSECVIIHFTEGDFTVSLENQKEKDIYDWTIHDIEHTLLSPITSADLYFCDEALNTIKGNAGGSNVTFSKDMTINSLLSKHGISKYFLEGSNSTLISKFFKEVGHTPTASLDDLHASVMSYCYIKMKSKHDTEKIENLNVNFSDEEKNKLKEIFESSYEITIEAFDNLKNMLKNCIILITSA